MKLIRQPLDDYISVFLKLTKAEGDLKTTWKTCTKSFQPLKFSQAQTYLYTQYILFLYMPTGVSGRANNVIEEQKENIAGDCKSKVKENAGNTQHVKQHLQREKQN